MESNLIEWSSEGESMESEEQDDFDRELDEGNLETRVSEMNEDNLQKIIDQVEVNVEKSAKDKSKVRPSILKALVSKQKKRFDIDGYNLDLTYITERIIAMGFPSIKLEGVYRNSLEDVQGFLKKRHNKHYRIYNLCAEKERQYPASNFDNEVACFPFFDHNAPPFTLIYDFCLDLDRWLKLDDNNIGAIHCKAGKGRTGLMICCYLLYCRQFTRAIEALKYYGMMRTKNKKGVTIPSQLRYIYYFEAALNRGWTRDRVPQPRFQITKIRMRSVPQMNFFGGSAPWFILTNNTSSYNSQKEFPLTKYKKEIYIDWIFEESTIVVAGDTKIEFLNASMTNKKERMFHIWFHTGFIDERGVVLIEKNMIDRACHDKACKHFHRDLSIEVTGFFVK